MGLILTEPNVRGVHLRLEAVPKMSLVQDENFQLLYARGPRALFPSCKGPSRQNLVHAIMMMMMMMMMSLKSWCGQA